MFKTEMKSLTWDDDEKEWVVTMVQDRTGQEASNLTVRSRFIMSASGILNCPKLPDLPGIEKFRGHSFHTSYWDYDSTGGSPLGPSLTNLKDKRVGLIGTGATAVQAVPHLAKWPKELYIFQRTPPAVEQRDNHPTDPEWWTNEVQIKKGWQRERMENFNAHISNTSPPPPVNLVADPWTKTPSYSALFGGPAIILPESIGAHVASLHALDIVRQQKIRGRVEEIAHDKTVAEHLKPWYPAWCKRLCFQDDYLPSFNLPNVTLVDTDARGVDQVPERGVMVGNSEYEIDLMTFSTGFRAPGVGSPAFRAGITITERNGQSLDQKWAEQVSTLHGVISGGFPNPPRPGPL
jgi:cation diffusion facilitator CzcD-associated flavoprotein CzcO